MGTGHTIRETLERELAEPSRLEAMHRANANGQHDELDTIDECGECDRILDGPASPAQAGVDPASSAADRRRARDEELVHRITGTGEGAGVCGVCCTDFRTPELKVLHLAADRSEAFAEIGGPVGVAARNAARRIADSAAAAAREAGLVRADRCGYTIEREAFADGYARNRKSPALEHPGPARAAHAAGWIERQRDEARLRGSDVDEEGAGVLPAPTWADARDAEHPVRWSPVSSEADRFLAVAEAVRRLVGYGYEAEVARGLLLEGRAVRTPFAFYVIDRPLDELELRAAWGDR